MVSTGMLALGLRERGVGVVAFVWCLNTCEEVNKNKEKKKDEWAHPKKGLDCS